MLATSKNVLFPGHNPERERVQVVQVLKQIIYVMYIAMPDKHFLLYIDQ